MFYRHPCTRSARRIEKLAQTGPLNDSGSAEVRNSWKSGWKKAKCGVRDREVEGQALQAVCESRHLGYRFGGCVEPESLGELLVGLKISGVRVLCRFGPENRAIRLAVADDDGPISELTSPNRRNSIMASNQNGASQFSGPNPKACGLVRAKGVVSAPGKQLEHAVVARAKPRCRGCQLGVAIHHRKQCCPVRGVSGVPAPSAATSTNQSPTTQKSGSRNAS